MSPHPDAPTRLADRYELGPAIGGGGMGTVHTARDTRLDRQVAVKLLHAHLAADDGMRRRFEDEGRTAARLAHPNVVQVYDSGESAGIPYLVMELVDGPTLGQRIAAGPIPQDDAREIAMGIAHALAAAHEQGIVHRDIKPGNVLLVDGVPKVTDFGIARAVEGLDRDTTTVILGTPTYAAPECLEGEPATPRSDVYAAGVVLAEMLTGERLPPGGVPGRVGGPLASVVARATSRDPADRPADGAALAALLGDPEAAAVPSTDHDDPPTVAMAVPAEVDHAATRVLPPRPVPRRDRGTAPARRVSPLVLGLLGVLLAVAVIAGVGALTGGSDSGGSPSPTTTTTTVPPTTAPAVTAAPSAGAAPKEPAAKTPKEPKAPPAKAQTGHKEK